MSFNLNKIVKEWSYRVHDGMPDMKNPLHMVKLQQVLHERKYPRKFIEALLNRLRETGKSDFPAVTKKGRTVYFGTAERQQAAINAKTHFKLGSPEAKEAERGEGESAKKKTREPAAAEKAAKVAAEKKAKQKTAEKAAKYKEANNKRVHDIVNDPNRSEVEKQDALEALKFKGEIFDLYPKIKITLARKGYGGKDPLIPVEIDQINPETGEPYEYMKASELLRRWTNEMLALVEDIPLEEKQAFAEYLSDPERQVDYNPANMGTLTTDLEKAGVPAAIVKRILTHTSQDEGKRGVGMGEFGMSLVFKNVRNSAGKGDLEFYNPETEEWEPFEVKGQGAVLGDKPTDKNGADRQRLESQGMRIGRLDFNDPDEKGDGLIYKGKKYKLNQLSDVLALRYQDAVEEGTEAEFMKFFRDMLTHDVHGRAEKEAFEEGYPKDNPNPPPEKFENIADELIADPEVGGLLDFTNPKDINTLVGIINLATYQTKDGFRHFIAHDYGAQGPNSGDYVYAKGSPIEVARQLIKTNIGFQKIAWNIMKPRVGVGEKFVSRDNPLTELLQMSQLSR